MQHDESKKSPPTTPELAREQLKQSEREASRTHPENFKEQEAESKTVSTERADQHSIGSIKGLDNIPEDPSTV